MRKERIYTDYSRWSDDGLATLSGRTVEFLTDNDAFTDLQPLLADYSDLVTDYRQKLEVTKNRGSLVEVTAKNKARGLLERMMKQLAFQVNMISEGDAHLLASSGFILVGHPQAMRTPHVPLFGFLEDGERSGEFNLRFESIPSAWEYEYQIASIVDESGEPEWREIQRTTNSQRNLIAPVTPGMRYYARVRSRNAKGESDWSVTISQFAR